MVVTRPFHTDTRIKNRQKKQIKEEAKTSLDLLEKHTVG